jgi:hypothetical protein
MVCRAGTVVIMVISAIGLETGIGGVLQRIVRPMRVLLGFEVWTIIIRQCSGTAIARMMAFLFVA